jgi:hypothetical protein
MGKLSLEPLPVNSADAPPWHERYTAELENYGRARDRHRLALQGGEGPEARDAAERAEWAAMQAVDVVAYNAAQSFLFGLRLAVRLHPEQTRDVLLIVLAEPIADAVMEGRC